MFVTLPYLIEQALAGEERPKNQDELEAELAAAKARGLRIPAIDIAREVITEEQARLAIARIGIPETALFSEIMSLYRGFPLGNGSELYPLQHILECVNRGFWDDEYPGFSKRFLQLSSIEGQSSYFYEMSEDAVYAVTWAEMADLTSGILQPTWERYELFLLWYYAPNM